MLQARCLHGVSYVYVYCAHGVKIFGVGGKLGLIGITLIQREQLIRNWSGAHDDSAERKEDDSPGTMPGEPETVYTNKLVAF